MISSVQDDLQKMIANDLGIGSLPVEQQQELIGQFGRVALKAATLAIVEKLSPDKRQEFATLAQGGDAEALQKFLDAQVPDHDQIAKQAVAAEIDKFKQLAAVS